MVAIKKNPFDKTTATDANGQAIALDKGRLAAAPHNFDSAKHAKLRRADFTSRLVYLQHQLLEFDREDDRRLEQRKDLIAAIKEERDGVPSAKSLKAKLDSMRAEAAKIEAQLKQQGVEVEA